MSTPPSQPASTFSDRESSLPTGESTAAAQYAWGNALRRRGDHRSAEGALRAALALDPTLFDARLSLAFLYRDLGHFEEAASVFDPWIESKPDDATLLGRVAQLLDALGDSGRALACYERAISLDDTLAPAWFERGRLFLQLGRFDEAAQSLGRALAIDPEHGAAYLLLVQTRRFTSSDPLIPFIESCAAQGRHSSSTQACLHFARGKIHDDLGHWEQALAEIEAGNTIRHQEIHFDRAHCETRMKQLLAIPPAFWIPRDPLPGQTVPEPFFIVGLPRAGTTLLERLFATHPALATSGESDALSLLLESLGSVNQGQTSRNPDRAGAPDLPVTESVEAVSCYRIELARGVSAGVHYVTDKNPLNFWHIGPIQMLFPHAPILAVERDPRDVLISLYFQNFDRPELAFSYAIPDILFYLNVYRTLMNHWQHCAGTRLRTVRYETLVHEPSTVVDEILGWLGLDPRDGQNSVERDQTVIRTASAWQARQPVYQRSVGRWKPYAQSLLKHYPELVQLGFSA
ncbi:MAG: sulfotransferase [Gammaproteobacteria bacterium]